MGQPWSGLRATGANTFSKTDIPGIQEGPKRPITSKFCQMSKTWAQDALRPPRPPMEESLCSSALASRTLDIYGCVSPCATSNISPHWVSDPTAVNADACMGSISHTVHVRLKLKGPFPSPNGFHVWRSGTRYLVCCTSCTMCHHVPSCTMCWAALLHIC